MKKIMLFAAAVLAAGLLGWLPATQRDIGNMLPVQTLILSVEDGRLVLDGGKDLKGTGGSWKSAMQDLRDTAPGDAFFGTTGQVILVGKAAAALPDVLQDQTLRPAARIYAGRGRLKVDTATAFLNAHPGETTIQSLQAAALEGGALTLPVLTCENGRYHLDDG